MGEASHAHIFMDPLGWKDPKESDDARRWGKAKGLTIVLGLDGIKRTL